MPETPETTIAFLLYSELTQLDLTGPWEVLTRVPGARCLLVGPSWQPVMSASGLAIVPTATFADCPAPDLIIVPGGPGHVAAMHDAALLAFLSERATGCRLIMAVCTGTLVLAAAGLLRGYRATTHWASLDRLAAFGITPVDQRVVTDRDRITGGGVTAGIDFGLAVAARLGGEDLARRIQLQIEYAPEPPYAGSPSTADPALVAALRQANAPYRAAMAAADRAALQRLGLGASS